MRARKRERRVRKETSEKKQMDEGREEKRKEKGGISTAEDNDERQ